MLLTEKESMREQLQRKIDQKTKPPGSLGRLEEIALQAGIIQQTMEPEIRLPHILVFAGDHGITVTGLVNPYPRAVTAQMVYNFLRGGAAINVFCRQHGIRLLVADAGVDEDFGEWKGKDGFIDAKVRRGTSNYLEEPAMSRTEVAQAITKGKEIVAAIHESGSNCIGFGEMGIGNTSSASLLMSAFTGIPVKDCVGKGTGTTEAQLETKKNTLVQVFQKHKPEMDEKPEAAEILRRFGGLEIAMMTGAYLEASARRMIIVVDGFIASAALLAALAIDPKVREFCIFAHTSGELGHRRLLEWLDAKPLLDLGMRLGEGTGAALAISLIRSAVQFLNEMASFESAGVSNKEETH
jgi:nicotinate-nucleotide--dimethylbenzimidazole phosphoribosyltransferase